jgi:hypothetical protein
VVAALLRGSSAAARCWHRDAVALLFAASNFVLVDVRLGGFTLETRLAWAVLVPAALGFAGGRVYYRRR